MRTLIYIAVFVVAFYLGYKISEAIILNKNINNNVKPIVNELKLQLAAIEEKIKSENITETERAELESQRIKILDLLAKFYGYTTEELKKLITN